MDLFVLGKTTVSGLWIIAMQMGHWQKCAAMESASWQSTSLHANFSLKAYSLSTLELESNTCAFHSMEISQSIWVTSPMRWKRLKQVIMATPGAVTTSMWAILMQWYLSSPSMMSDLLKVLRRSHLQRCIQKALMLNLLRSCRTSKQRCAFTNVEVEKHVHVELAHAP